MDTRSNRGQALIELMGFVTFLLLFILITVGLGDGAKKDIKKFQFKVKEEKNEIRGFIQ